MKNNRRKDIHNQWYDYKNTLKCQKCNDNRWYILDFYHINPDEKEDTLGNMIRSGFSKNRIMKEVEKYIVLCSNCHTALHNDEIKI